MRKKNQNNKQYSKKKRINELSSSKSTNYKVQEEKIAKLMEENEKLQKENSNLKMNKKP